MNEVLIQIGIFALVIITALLAILGICVITTFYEMAANIEKLIKKQKVGKK